MTHLKFCQFRIQFIWLIGHRRLLRHYHYLAISADFDTSYPQTGRGYGLYGPSHFRLTE
jgi:hypothetical protein